MLTFDHLELKDLFVTRFVCKEFKDHAYRAVASRKQQVRRHWPSKERRKFKQKLRTAFNAANYFYETVSVPKPAGFWCKRCFQVKTRADFSDVEWSRPLKDYGRYCWKCTDKNWSFRLGGLEFQACGVRDCSVPIPNGTGYWRQESLNSYASKVCVHCWPTFRRTLKAEVKAKYGYHCACNSWTPKCDFVCEEEANDVADEADIKAGRTPIL